MTPLAMVAKCLATNISKPNRTLMQRTNRQPVECEAGSKSLREQRASISRVDSHDSDWLSYHRFCANDGASWSRHKSEVLYIPLG